MSHGPSGYGVDPDFIKASVARAHQMRSEAVREMFNRLFARLRTPARVAPPVIRSAEPAVCIL